MKPKELQANACSSAKEHVNLHNAQDLLKRAAATWAETKVTDPRLQMQTSVDRVVVVLQV